jgi:hypothetical protein
MLKTTEQGSLIVGINMSKGDYEAMAIMKHYCSTCVLSSSGHRQCHYFTCFNGFIIMVICVHHCHPLTKVISPNPNSTTKSIIPFIFQVIWSKQWHWKKRKKLAHFPLYLNGAFKGGERMTENSSICTFSQKLR